jgi:hypothetical protein
MNGSKPIFDAKKTCLFEATDRIGGRAYSKGGIPGMQDIRVDLGAYRFDSHAHPLVNEVIVNTLKLPVRCDNPTTGLCNLYGNLSTVRDAYGNNAGYANGPEGLVKLFVDAGGRIAYEHRLTAIHDSTPAGSMVLTFGNGKTVTCKDVFLNMPATAIAALDQSSLLFTKTPPIAKKALLTLPKQNLVAKQYLIYPSTMWRTVPVLSSGFFGNLSLTPPQKGRYHDFYGKCSGASPQNNDCKGAILVFYSFSTAATQYFAGFQNSTSDPYTYIPLEGNTNTTQTDMILAAHKNLIAAMNKTLIANNVTFDLSSIPPPSGTVIAVWWARDEASALFPGTGFFGGKTSTFEYALDPNHAIRNMVSKPLDTYNLYIGNEAYSSGNGWAHPALILTERILWHHFKSKPSFVKGCNDCLTGACIVMTVCIACILFGKPHRRQQQSWLRGLCELSLVAHDDCYGPTRHTANTSQRNILHSACLLGGA